ncbi:DUF5519 family protein [Yeosuana sp. MJ-SS3]|uniref:DUF5519 family protein n=1 Tax=Gilvirhabdus luticola TaxID=3079858 RepID=A0ABU3U4X7_9FLAO|nr:luciferase family protein [Yeosuana sp. MJ-SS3]MDU8885386.1 DUF5519 family protein [Yeosuana sp. MJ-SS3]
MVISCTNDSSRIDNNIVNNGILADDENIVTCASSEDLPARDGSPPETTTDIPHMQLGGFEQIPQVIEELFRRVYSIPGIENRESAILGWRALWLTEEVNIVVPEALIRDREFGHIHDDASLHIFLEPTRSNQAVSACWAIFHPFAVQNLPEWNGFVMLYTPQSIEELNVTFQLIVEAFNYVTGQNLVATDYY